MSTDTECGACGKIFCDCAPTFPNEASPPANAAQSETIGLTPFHAIGEYVFDKNGSCIAMCDTAAHGYETNRAHAKLFSAAPELYEAARAAMRRDTNWETLMVEAIKKVTGGLL